MATAGPPFLGPLGGPALAARSGPTLHSEKVKGLAALIDFRIMSAQPQIFFSRFRLLSAYRLRGCGETHMVTRVDIIPLLRAPTAGLSANYGHRLRDLFELSKSVLPNAPRPPGRAAPLYIRL